MSKICVFCGSSKGNSPIYAQETARLGHMIAKAGHTLVYGGANVGLMGILADSALQAGGNVIGILPMFIADHEIAHHDLTELHLVDSMMTRKQMMVDMSDAFITMPGGLGTLDELFEIWTWRQLNIHQKPFGILNINHYFDGLLEYLQQNVEAGFVKSPIIDEMLIGTNSEQLLQAVLNYKPNATGLADKLSLSMRKV